MKNKPQPPYGANLNEVFTSVPPGTYKKCGFAQESTRKYSERMEHLRGCLGMVIGGGIVLALALIPVAAFIGGLVRFLEIIF